MVIVESPTKAKTLAGILGKDYKVTSSKGHVMDLPKSGLGVDVEHDFKPEYIVPTKAKKVLASLRKDAKEAEQIFLAMDPDREGEAIAWHLQETLQPKTKKNQKEFLRVTFHELTKSAVEQSFEHLGKLDMRLVDAQQARRVLDRLVGYKLSPLLWKKVRFGLSAGRVQSVAVRLVVERERERDAFKPEEYWGIEGLFAAVAGERGREVKAALAKYKGKKIEPKTEKESKKIETALKDDTFEVEEVKKSERKRKPYPPLRTSTLQQAGANVFGFTAKKTMRAAQRLFEAGLITYHRTDSLNMSGQFVNSARDYIKSEFGEEYLPEKGVFYKTKSKSAQEAHEAVRPTKVNLLPKHLPAKKVSADERKIYSLIWKRALESQVMAAVYDQTHLSISSQKGYVFKASGSVIKFDGWLKVGEILGLDTDAETLHRLPDFEENEKVTLKDLALEQHFTQPPARYSDATLIKTLEENGIGRPSTYAPTITTIQERGYVAKEGKYFFPQDVAYVVIDLLCDHFPNIVDYDFTAGMEEDLDDIAEGKKEWVPIVREFYTPFEKTLKVKDKELNKHDVTNLGETDQKCPECGKVLIIKLGKFGKFLSCSGYPDCKYAQPMEEDKILDDDGKEITDFGKCPECEDGHFVLKQGRFGKFLACSNYPKCKTTKQFEERIGMTCPKCKKGEIVVKKAKRRGKFFGCNRYPDCDWTSWKDPRPESQESQKS